MGSVSDAMKRRQAEQAAREQKPTEQKPAAEPKGPGPVQAALAAARSAAEAQPPAEAAPPPRVRNANYSSLLCVHADRGGGNAEAYRALRTNLLAQCNNQQFCHVVTSSVSGEGKTVTCLNLALVMAERQDCQTVVVDCDLRRGQVARLLKGKRAPGVTELLRGEVKMEDVLQPTAYPNLSFISCGKAAGNEVGELITRPSLAELFKNLRRRYDYVLIDTPPMNLVAETGMIGRLVGEVLLVVRANKTKADSVQQAVRLLRAAGIHVAGLVLNQQTEQAGSYSYNYY